MAGCVASTPSVETTIDGAGTLRSSVRISPQPFNPIAIVSDGLVKPPPAVRYGWGAGGSTASDLYSAPVAIDVTSGLVEYGPRVAATYQAPFGGGALVAHVGWEIEASYSGSANSPFSGITFEIQGSGDAIGWTTLRRSVNLGATGRTWRWSVDLIHPLYISDTATHTFFVRSMVQAGVFAAGESVLASATERRSVTIVY